MTPDCQQPLRPARTAPRGCAAALAALAVSLALPAAAHAQPAAAPLYAAASQRERTVRENVDHATLADLRDAIRAYEAVVRRYPRSGYCDNALWQAAGLASTAFERFHDPADRRSAEALLRWLRREYPRSSLAARADAQLKLLATVEAPAAPTPPANVTTILPAAPPGPTPPAPLRPSRQGAATIRQLSRQSLPTGVRVVIELDGDVEYMQDQLANPTRVFIDLKGAQLSTGAYRSDLGASDDLIRAIRVGQRPDGSRVVVELVNETRYTLIALYDPFRLVLDFERTRAAAQPESRVAAPAASPSTPPRLPAKVAAEPPVSPPPSPGVMAKPVEGVEPTPATTPAAGPPPPLASTPTAPPVLPAPKAPATNSDGAFSLARQLGLGVARVVIDPGHGGHDPGAQAFGLDEAAIVLDIGIRLETLLKAAGVDVVMTRRSDVFIPLEERTALANRENADLFLSIHANASPNGRATGIETYYLNFASNPEAERVAARENSASGRTMHNLSDIVQAIALNTKLDESRDLARFVQDAVVKRARAQNKGARNLGVKQAPFVVLIGAQMPSVLAEVSFITNRSEASLLGKPSYRDRLAQALFDAVMRYQKALKASVAVARRSTPDLRN